MATIVLWQRSLKCRLRRRNVKEKSRRDKRTYAKTRTKAVMNQALDSNQGM